MIRLDEIPAAFANEHRTALETKTRAKIAEEFAKLPAAMRATYDTPGIELYLTDHVDSLLTGTPRQLRKHIRHFRRNASELHDYAKLNPKKTNDAAYNKDLAALVKAIHKAFDYDAFSEKRSGWCAYRLVKVHKLRLCPYCNLHHVNFHDRQRRKRKAPKLLSMRPPLDHFYPRSAYPYLGLSIYNLIPSCHQCNSSIKLQQDPLDHALPHPFHFPEKRIKFEVNNFLAYKDPVEADAIALRIGGKRPPERRHVAFFELAARYGWYAHEIEDVHRRYLDYVKANPILAHSLENYILLGYQDKDRGQRSLGICLHDLVGDWIKYLPK